ncbi:hypothetical protein QQF64_019477 [Cirrhinus molitorella]|uniref:MHC class I antigen n=1 Tax=Cirrhinus molitorella TaxID=172907 RepID=A0ABR3LI20_9TELE
MFQHKGAHWYTWYQDTLGGFPTLYLRESFNQIPREVGDIESEWTIPGMPHWEEAPGKSQDMLEEVARERKSWASLLRLLPPRPGPG